MLASGRECTPRIWLKPPCLRLRIIRASSGACLWIVTKVQGRQIHHRAGTYGQGQRLGGQWREEEKHQLRTVVVRIRIRIATLSPDELTSHSTHRACKLHTFIPSISEFAILIRTSELHDLFPSRFHPNFPSYLFMFIAFHQSSTYRFDSHAWFDFSVSKDKSHFSCFFLFPVFGFRFCFTFTFGRIPVCSCCLSLLSFQQDKHFID